MKRIILAMITTLVILSGCQATEEIKNKSRLIVELINFYVDTAYNNQEAIIEYEETEDMYIARIVDIDNGDILASYFEMPLNMSVEEAIKKQGIIDVENYRCIISGSYDFIPGRTELKGKITVDISTYVEIENSATSKQIISTSEFNHTVPVNALYSFHSPTTYDQTSSYPSDLIQININGIIEISDDAIVLINNLKEIGYQLNDSGSMQWDYGYTFQFKLK